MNCMIAPPKEEIQNAMPSPRIMNNPLASPRSQQNGRNLLNLTFDGKGGISDDEVNSWEDDVSDSDDSEKIDYGDEEEYDDETALPGGPDDVGDADANEVEGDGGGDGDDQVDEDDEDLEEYGSEDDIPPDKRLVMNVHCTEYDVVRKVGRKMMNYKLRYYKEDHEGAIRRGEHNQKLRSEWDLSWHDLSISPDFLAKMYLYQKVNHYPGMYVVTRKNHLARNLMRMKRLYAKEYNFFPQTWVLPGDNIDFRNQFGKAQA